MALRDDFISLMSGVLGPEEQEAVLSAAGEAMSEFVRSHPTVRDDLIAITSRRLSDGVNDDSWGPIELALSCYLGDDLAALITWLVFDDNQAGRLAQLEPHASPEAVDVLRTLLALFGFDLQRAFGRWQDFPNNWRTVFREVNLEQVTNRTIIKLRIVKFNDEQVTVEGPPESMMDLVRNIVSVLTPIVPTYAFRPSVASAFVEEVTALTTALGAQLSHSLDATATPEAAGTPAPDGTASEVDALFDGGRTS